MRTWLVIYEENGTTKTRVLMAKTFTDIIVDICEYVTLEDIKGIFEVAR